MSQPTREQLRRERLREYEAALAAAHGPVAVLAMFAQARESRADEALEEQFAATPADGEDVRRLPAAVWVALRNNDLDTTVAALVELSRDEVVLDTHEELDSGYRLTTVEERRALPDVALLVAQLGAFMQIPSDVVSMIAGWGPDDPRAAAEIEALIERRFGAARASDATGPTPNVAVRHGRLAMSSDEFAALLSLSPDQRRMLATLVRQSEILIGGGSGDQRRQASDPDLADVAASMR